MISIIVPTHNKKNVLKKTLQNILQQTYLNIEIIVVDDASTDNTKQAIEKIQSKKINYFYNKKQMGTSKSRILGIKKSSGNYIAFLDDDDWWNPDKLRWQHQLIIEKKLDFIMSNYLVNDKINNKKHIVYLNGFVNNFISKIVVSPGPFLQCCLFKKEFILKHLSSFDSLAEPSEDWDWFISISKEKIKFENVNKLLFQWNLSKDSQSANTIKETQAIEYIINKHLHYFLQKSNYKNISFQYRRLGGMFYQNNKPNKAKKYYNLAFKTNPWSIKNIFLKYLYG